MSYSRPKNIFEKFKTTRSSKSFAQNFILGTMAGQKKFLYNYSLPRIFNISFNEKVCMLACKVCPFSDEEVRNLYKDESVMSFETLKNIVKNVPNDSYYSFDISSIGETLQFDKLSDYISYIKQQKPLANTVISTNGLLLNEESFISLVRSGLDNLQISLFAENAHDYSILTGYDGFDKVSSNIIKISNLKKKIKAKKPFIQVFMLESQETKNKVERFIIHWSKYVDKAFVRPIYNAGRVINGVTPAFKELVLADRYPCVVPWYSTAINSKGDVLPCYFFHWSKEALKSKIGNINDLPLWQIFESESFRKFRKAHLGQEFDSYQVCKNCNAWSAYSNIWEKKNNVFEYSKITLTDFFKPAPYYRGG